MYMFLNQDWFLLETELSFEGWLAVRETNTDGKESNAVSSIAPGNTGNDDHSKFTYSLSYICKANTGIFVSSTETNNIATP